MTNRFLVGDVGGTKTALALVSNGNLFERVEEYPSKKYNSLEDLVQEFLKGEEIDKACFGVAGPIKNGSCQTTNLPWFVESKNISERFHISEVFLLNDLVASGYGIKNIPEEKLCLINKGDPTSGGNQVIISPGTGLGQAFIVHDGTREIPVSSEGGHADFAPRSDLEIDLYRYLRKKFGHVSYERILSGEGLSNLYEFFSGGKEKKPQDVTKEMVEYGMESFGGKSVRLFCEILGAESGNFALRGCATGGVFIGGGVSLKVLDQIKGGDFMKGFLDKGRFCSFLKDIPVRVILDSQISLQGALNFLQLLKQN
jgi:glucokinase